MRDGDLSISELDAEVSMLRKELAETRIEIVNGSCSGYRLFAKSAMQMRVKNFRSQLVKTALRGF